MNKSYKITVYTSENCAFCNSAKQLLRKKEKFLNTINSAFQSLILK